MSPENILVQEMGQKGDLLVSEAAYFSLSHWRSWRNFTGQIFFHLRQAG
jgi:hypothetical protein